MPSLYLVLLVAVVSCTDCEPIQKELQDVKQELTERDSILGQLGRAFDVVDSNLSSMQVLEGELESELLSGRSQNVEEIEAKVEKVKEIMERNRTYIDELRAQLETETGNTAFLSRMVESLEIKVETYEKELAGLNEELAGLDESYRILADDYGRSENERERLAAEVVRQKREANTMKAQMTDMDNRMNTVYVAIGTKGELTSKGVLESGGLLKSREINEDVNQMAFEPHDLRELDWIELGSKKAKLVTEHPTESYTLKTVNGEKVLVIDSPKEFWSLSKYLVVVRH